MRYLGYTIFFIGGLFGMTTYKKTWKHIRRSACAFTILSVALLSSACKRQQEVIDLSGARATPAPASTVQAAPEGADSASGLMLDTPQMTTGSSDSSAVSDSAAPAKKGIHALMETYMSNKVFIQYPVIQDLNDADRAAAANALLKENALSILAGWGLNESKDTLELTCKVLSADQSRITVLYRGYCYPSQASYPTNLLFTNTIDLTKVSNVRLNDYADPVLLTDYILSDNVVLSGVSQEEQPEILDFLKSTDRDQDIEFFRNADFSGNGSFPQCFSYESDGDIYLIIPVAHALGDYVTVIYTPEEK